MKSRISMITLGVADLAASTRFYEEGLGLSRLPFDGDAVFFNLSGTWLGLYPWEELAKDAQVLAVGEGFRGVTLAHNLASKEEVDEVMAQAERAGAIVKKAPQDVFWGGYSGYFEDPDGHLWELAWNPHFWVGPEDE